MVQEFFSISLNGFLIPIKFLKMKALFNFTKLLKMNELYNFNL